MGFDVQRFVDVVDDEYFCSICLMVFENPVHGPCGHTFCSACIENWIPLNVNACPLDKKPLYKKDLTQVSLPFRNLLTRLRIKCDYEVEGCKFVCQMGLLPEHVKMCPFNPNGEMICDMGCDLTFLRKEKDSHKCIVALKELVSKQRIEIADLKRAPKRGHDGNLRSTLDSSSMAYYNRSSYALDQLHSYSEARDAHLLRYRRFRSDQRARTPPPRTEIGPSDSSTGPTIHARVTSFTPTELVRQRSSRPMASSSSFDTDSRLTSENLSWLTLPDVEVRVPRMSDDDIAQYTRPELRGLRGGGAGSNTSSVRAVLSTSSSSSSSSSQSSSPTNNASGSMISQLIRADPMLSSTTPDSSRQVGLSSSHGNGNNASLPSSSTGLGRPHDLLSQMLSSRSSQGCGATRSSDN